MIETGTRHERAVETLLASAEPAIRFKTRVALGEDPGSPDCLALREEIRASQTAAALLSGQADDGRLFPGSHVYNKWTGAHWVMAALADIGYPPGDASLAPVAEQLHDAWLGPSYFAEFEPATKSATYTKAGVPVMQGRHRRCASQQGNALYAISTLGLATERTAALAERLLHWQWPDGGWNCDKNPDADTSSFMETLTPLRGLVAFGRIDPSPALQRAVNRAADVFLERQLFRRRSDGQVIRQEFTLLHYPLYWHYDILGGLKVMAEAGLIGDRRCEAALDLLESKRLPDGGYPAERQYYRKPDSPVHPDAVNWGGTSKRTMNGWVTADALTVLAAAGRL